MPIPRKLAAGLALASAAAMAMAGIAVAAGIVVVRPSAMDGWVAAPTVVGPTVVFESGPAVPPAGGGSVELAVGADGDEAAQVRNTVFHGTALADVTALKYSTYVDIDGVVGGQAPYIILHLDYDGDLVPDDLLFFEPVYQTAVFFPAFPQAALVLDAWQAWDALSGGWWSLFGTEGAGPGTDVKGLGDILAVEPDATIVNTSSGNGGVRIVAGFGAGAWDGFVGNADAFMVGVSSDTTTYDFEPNLPQRPNKNACKKGGWAGYARADGSPFKNQGDCVQYVNTGK